MDTQIPRKPNPNRKELKGLLRRLLQDRALENLVRMALERRDVERALNSLLFDSEEMVRWRALEAVGRVCAVMAAERMESVRERIRRLLWAMNDESGNSIQHAPQLMGEILANVPELIPEFVQYLPSFRDSSRHEQGIAWAMARVAMVAPNALDGCTDELIEFLRSPDSEVRGLALLALSRDAGGPVELLHSLQHDPSGLRYYDPVRGEFLHTTVAEMAGRRVEI